MNVSRIDELCKAHRITRAELEKRVGLSNGSISRWADSVLGPSVSLLQRVADYFHVTIDELYVKE